MDNPEEMKFDPTEWDERAVYRVTVQRRDSNPPHAAVMITGFHTGSYAKVVGPSFDETHPSKYYAIEVHEKICQLPTFGAFDDAEMLTDDYFWSEVPHGEFPPTGEGKSDE
jgi:hypothetical protein